jgi:PilZ domain
MRIVEMIDTLIEKRSAPRHKVLKGGTIAFGGNGIECTVRNLSSRGAALEVASPVGVPPSFVLLIEADQFIRRCRPVWRSDKRIGVEFD